MGHYASEIDSSWNEMIEKQNRKRRLREKIKNIPLGYFTVADLEPLIRLEGPNVVTRDISIPELEQLEKRVEEIIAGQTTFHP